MSFGYSVGDFLAGANLTYQLVRALSASQGACIEYQEALTELRAMEQAFLQTGNLVRSKMFTTDVINAIACIALSSIDTIEKFLERTRDLRSRLDHKKTSLDNSWSKVGWQLYRKEELRVLKTQLHERLSSINTLITTASNCIELPSAVAQYQDRSTESPTNDNSKRESNRSSFQPELSQCDSTPLSSPTTTTSCVSDQMLNHPQNLIEVTKTNTLRVNESSVSSKIGHFEQKSAPALHHNPPAQKSSPTLATDHESSTPRKQEFDKVTPRIEKSQAELEREIRAKIEVENAEAAVAAETAVADAQFKSNIEMMMRMVTSLHEKEARREAEAKATAEKAKEVKAPIRFKDAVGRKFSFPFHECQRWQGMEELIKQAFLHVDVLEPQVQAGHYDVVGPDGEIILPQVWDKVIQPDWHISMHMWPMDPPKVPTKYPTNDPRSGVPLRPIGAPGEQRAKPDSKYEPKQPINHPQFQAHSRPNSEGAKGGPRETSEFGLLDRFDPNWRDAYQDMISSRGLTNEFIRTHQAEIIEFLQNERKSATGQRSKEAASYSGDRYSTCPSASQESEAQKQRPRYRKSRSSKPKIALTKRRQETGWQTDED